MAGVELGAYYVSVIPSTSGAAGAIKSGIGGPASAEATAASAALSKGIGGGAASGAANAKAQLGGIGSTASGQASVAQGSLSKGIGGGVASGASTAKAELGGIGSTASSQAATAQTSLSKGIGGGVAAGSTVAKQELASVGRQAESVSGVLGKLALGGAVVTTLSRAARDADESRKVASQTEAVIRSTGRAAKVTAAQVGEYATAISKATGLDDEWVQSGENMLLTFKNIRNEAGEGNDIFKKATSIMADMAVATGTDAKSAALQLGKALNDPISGVSKLARVGVTFTEQQKEQIRTMVESGNVMGAQKLMLAELSSEFGGSAAAQASGLAKIKTELGNFSETVGSSLLPMLDAAGSGLATLTPLLNAVPGPVLAGTVAVVGGATAWTLLGGAVTRTTATVAEWGVAIRGVVTGSAVATAATEGLAAAMSVEAEAAGAAAAATGGRTAATSKARGAWTAAGIAATVASVGLTKWLDSTRRAPADIDAMTRSLEKFAATGRMTGAGQRQGGITQLISDMKLFNREGKEGVNKWANNTVGAIYRALPGAGDDRLTNLTKQIGQYDNALASMVASGKGEAAAGAFERIKSAMLAQGLSGSDVKRYLNDYLQAASDAGVATDVLSFKIADAQQKQAAANAAWGQNVEKNGLVAALKAAQAEADSLQTKLDEVASAARTAMGKRLAVPEAQDAQAKAQNELNDAIAEARQKGYTGDFMDMRDTSSVALDLRDKFRSLQSATSELDASLASAGYSASQVGEVNARLQEQFADTTGLAAGKKATDEYRTSVDQLTWALIAQAQAQAQATRAAQIDAFNKANPQLSMGENGHLSGVPAGYTETEWYSMFGGASFFGGAPKRAGGGRVAAGTLYRVNELGVEGFRPDVSGTVIPMGQMSRGGTDRPIVVNIYNPQAERASASIPRAGRELAAALGGT